MRVMRMTYYRTPHRDRFTRKSRVGRSRVPNRVKEYVFERDDYTCQYCRKRFPKNQLTIDHLIPLAHGGIDELTNYVTACKCCNEKKSSTSLTQFARYINIDIKQLPVHGDPIIDDAKLPIQFRLLRKSILDKTRAKDGRLQRSREAQKRLEKAFRLEFHRTELGEMISEKYPNLPGPVRVMLPQILTIGKDESELRLLIELAKSAHTRNLIGSEIRGRTSVLEELENVRKRVLGNPALLKRIDWALNRWQKTN